MIQSLDKLFISLDLSTGCPVYFHVPLELNADERNSIDGIVYPNHILLFFKFSCG
jgi:hypothetical protein